MAVTDEILTRYKLDIQQPEQAMNRYAQTLSMTEEAGEKAFVGIGEAAQNATPKIANAGKAAERSKSHFNSLGNSINQLSRELPAFALNLNTGFLAISNNLPALADAIGQIKRQNAELAAQGKQTTSVLSQVASALFSWQTAMSVGITLLTIYGGKIISFITGQKDSAEASKQAEAALKKYNDQLKIQRLLQKTWDDDTKNQIAALEKQTSSLEKVVNQQDLILKQKQDIAALNESEEQSIQDLFKAYEVSYTDYLDLQKAMADPKFAAALGETRMKQLRGEADAMDKFLSETGISSFTPLLNTSKEFNNQLNAIQVSYAEQRKSLEQKQRKEFFDLLTAENNKIADDEIANLRRSLKVKEAAGEQTYEIQLEILRRELALLDTATQAYKDKIAERDAFIAKEAIEKETKMREQGLKIRAQQEEQALDEINQITDEYLEKRQKLRDKKLIKEKEQRELLGESVEAEKRRRERQKEILVQEEGDFRTSYDRRIEIFKELYEENYITEQEYAEKTAELERAKKMVALDTISSVASALGAFATILGQNTEAGKALAIAQTTIDTYVAAQKAYLSQMALATPDAPIRATIAAAAAVAQGLARVATISGVGVPKPAAGKAPAPTGQSAGFKDGVVDLNGPGTGTSDSIPAWLSRGESVITAKSTAAKSDELKALNDGVVNYEMLLYKKYVKPAVDAEQEKQNQFAANVARSIAMHSAFNDTRIVKAIEKNRPATGKDIAKLSEQIAKQTRIAKFESNLKQSK